MIYGFFLNFIIEGAEWTVLISIFFLHDYNLSVSHNSAGFYEPTKWMSLSIVNKEKFLSCDKKQVYVLKLCIINDVVKPVDLFHLFLKKKVLWLNYSVLYSILFLEMLFCNIFYWDILKKKLLLECDIYSVYVCWNY